MNDDIDNLVIRNALIDNYTNDAAGLDSKNWDVVRSCFMDDIYIDYGALSASTGAPDEPRKADDWMVYLRSVIDKFDITRHAITNHRVAISDELVRCRAYLCADHVKFQDPSVTVANADDVATVVGEYANAYVLDNGVWKISRSQLVVHYSTGNLALFA